MENYEFFDDIAIPERKKSDNDNFIIRFNYDENECSVSMAVLRDGEEWMYLGRGRVFDGFVDTKLSPLTIIDPFLENSKTIPSKYLKIVLKVIIPKITASNLIVERNFELTNVPFAVITVKGAHQSMGCLVEWYDKPYLFKDVRDLDGYIYANGRFYKGSLDDVNTLISFDSENAAVNEVTLSRLYASSSYLFKFESPALEERFKAPKKYTTDRIRMSDLLGQMGADVPSYAVPKKNDDSKVITRSFGGPVLLESAVRVKYRTTSAKYTAFVHEAKRLINMDGRKCEFVPFVCYLPVYSAMTKEQHDWYFYWRSQFRLGNILKTDFSYIFVAIYEIINKAVPLGEDALDRMIALWKAYRDDYPRLDRYMPQWCADYILLNSIDRSLDSIVNEVSVTPDCLAPYPEIYYNDTLKNGFSHLPIEVLYCMSDHDARSGRLYKNGFGNNYEDALRKALTALEEYSMSAYDEPLMEHLAPPESQVSWESYRGAVCAHAAARKVEIRYRPYSMSKEFRTFLSSVMKHVENIVRAQLKLVGRLRSYELDSEYMKVIDRALHAETVPTQTVKQEETEESRAAKEYAKRLQSVDISKASELEHESWENTKLLLDAIGEELVFEEEVEVIEPEDEDDGDILSVLTELELKVVKILADGGDASEIDALCAAEFTFPDAVYDSINEKASDILGDILIDTSDVPMIIEDYADWF